MAQLIEVTHFCESFHCLPNAGGLFDQGLYVTVGMSKVKAAMAEKEKKDAKEREDKVKSQANTKSSGKGIRR